MSIAYTNFRKGTARINAGNESVTNEITNIETSKPLLNLHVSCRDVIKLDIGSPSDPMCVMFIPVDGKYVEIARTEVIWNDPNPKWVKFFQTLYIFEMVQPLHFVVYDCDSEKADLSKHDLVGFADTTVQNIVSSGAEPLQLELRHPTEKNKRGTLIINSEQATQSSSLFSAHVQFHGLKKIGIFTKTKPFLIISKPVESGANVPVFRSETIPGAQSGTWRPFTVPLQVLCNGDQDVPLTFSVYHYHNGKPATLIGSFQESLQRILENSQETFNLLNSKRATVGAIKFRYAQIIRKPTFVDYLRSGLQLNLVTAVDFTASNRDPRDPKSLHFLSNSMNAYEQCISSVGSIVCPYDSDQLFPVYGFGGKVAGNVSHCFPLTFDQNNPNVQGLQNILGAYRYALSNVQLSGPTLFSPIIRAATGLAQASFTESRTYTISDQPLSIIIVGVGNANFDSMDVLDADETPLKARNGTVMKRDIVQFVPFNKFLSRGGIGLAEEVLEEVPRQVDEFCSSHGFIPNF